MGKDFLLNGCAGVLKPGGILTICTDSPEYGEWLMKAFASPALAAVFEDALLGTKAHKAGRFKVEGAIHLRIAPPPIDVCGAEYSGEAGGSYFQKLKSKERNSRKQDK